MALTGCTALWDGLPCGMCCIALCSVSVDNEFSAWGRIVVSVWCVFLCELSVVLLAIHLGDILFFCCCYCC